MAQMVYDIGAHNGDDTARYLSEGYDVIAVEANPVLAGLLHQRFAEELAQGRLVVVPAGVHPQRGTATFYVSSSDELSSFVYERATAYGATATATDVSVLPLAEVMATHGTPHYLKIDIEGMDAVCISELTPDTAPRYLSVEMSWDAPAVIKRLEVLGYKGFKIINQWGHHRVTPRTLLLRNGLESEPDHTAGPFGEAADGPWLKPRTAFFTAAALTLRRSWQGRELWHDLHAARGMT